MQWEQTPQQAMATQMQVPKEMWSQL